MFATVTWRSISQLKTLEELDKALDDIASDVSPDYPQAVHVERSNGDVMTIVPGSEAGTILNFSDRTGQPPYFSSVGNPSRPGTFVF